MMQKAACFITILTIGILSFGTACHAEKLMLTEGKAEVIHLPAAAAEVLVSNPAIADVSLPSQRRLYIMAQRTGEANIFVFDAAGEVIRRYDVHVRIDEDKLADTLSQLMPSEAITVRTVGRNVMVTGEFSSTSAAQTGRMVIRRFVEDDENLMDLTSIRGAHQVLLRVRIVEVEKNILNELGVNPGFGPDSFFGNSVTASLATAAGLGLSSTPFATGSLLFSPGGFGPISLAVQALEQDGLAKLLAEPNLTAVSGETASFLAGGEFPIPVAQSRDGAITIEFRPFGVSLAFTPTVLSDDRIVLRLGTEVSSLSQEGAIELDNVIIPALSVRRAETTVEMASGGSLMIAGLLQSKTAKAVNGVPGVKNMPVLGSLFRSDSFKAGETELLVMVTALLVEPYAEQLAKIQGQQGVDDISGHDLGLGSALATHYPTPKGGADQPEPKARSEADKPAALGGYMID